MLKDIKKKVVEIFLIIIAMILLCTVMVCPFKFFLGVACPGCGMTRAFISLLHLDIKNATIYHPLWPLVILIAIFIIVAFKLKKSKGVIINEKIRKIIVILIAFIFLIVYTIRIMYKDPIVIPNFKSGFIYKIINYFIMMR